MTVGIKTYQNCWAELLYGSSSTNWSAGSKFIINSILIALKGLLLEWSYNVPNKFQKKNKTDHREKPFLRLYIN